MARRAPAGRPFDLGDWRVDPALGRIVARDGRAEARLEPRLMDLLLLFAASPGRVLAKDEIIASVWDGRAIGDDTLAAALSHLRTALGDAGGKRYIETLPKRGYRLVAGVDSPPGAPPAASAASPALVAQGLAALKVPLPAQLAQAQLYIEAALKADPGSAGAHAALSETLLVKHFMGLGPASVLLPAAKASAQAAIGLDDRLAEGWAGLGCAILLQDRDFAAADRALQRAIALDPGLAAARRYRAFALAATGRFVEAEREARAAVEAEPLSLSGRGVLLQILLLARRYRTAVAEARRALELAPGSSEAWSALGWARALLGEEAEAVDALLNSLRGWSVDETTITGLLQAHARGGFEALAAAGADLFQSQKMVFRPRPLDIAMLRAVAGDADAAFAALEEVVAHDDPFALFLPWLPHLDRLRNDHRFAALLARMRLIR